jgi:hypothetical protein
MRIADIVIATRTIGGPTVAVAAGMATRKDTRSTRVRWDERRSHRPSRSRMDDDDDGRRSRSYRGENPIECSSIKEPAKRTLPSKSGSVDGQQVLCAWPQDEQSGQAGACVKVG